MPGGRGRVMLPFLTVVVVLALLPRLSFGQEIVRGPYIQNITTTSVDILWRTDSLCESVVEIRRLSQEPPRILLPFEGEGEPPMVVIPERSNVPALVYLSNIPTTRHHIHVPRLEPNTWYEYRVGRIATDWSDDTLAFQGMRYWLHTDPIAFQTLPAGDAGTSFSFLGYGDHRNNPEAHASVVRAMLEQIEDRGWPRFLLDSGDLTGQGESPVDPYDAEFFGPAGPLMRHLAYFTAIGNHESPRRHPRIPLRYLENYVLPWQSSGTPYYYSFRVGDALFIVLDSYATDFTTGSKQWWWLRQQLRSATETWRFVMIHHPPFVERVGPSPATGDPQVREHLVPLFEKYGVAMVLSGDSHFYQRSEVNGVTYVCSAGGGAPLYDPGNSQPYVRHSFKGYHYSWFTLEDDELIIEAFDVENNLIERASISPRIPVGEPQPELTLVRRMPPADAQPETTVIIETRNADGSLVSPEVYEETGTGWMNSVVKSTAEGLTGKGSRFTDNVETDARAIFRPELDAEGWWLLSVTVPSAGSADAARTLLEVTDATGQLVRAEVDLSHRTSGNQWLDVGLIRLAPGAVLTFIEVEEQADRFYTDAIRLQRYDIDPEEATAHSQP